MAESGRYKPAPLRLFQVGRLALTSVPSAEKEEEPKLSPSIPHPEPPTAQPRRGGSPPAEALALLKFPKTSSPGPRAATAPAAATPAGGGGGGGAGGRPYHPHPQGKGPPA